MISRHASTPPQPRRAHSGGRRGGTHQAPSRCAPGRAAAGSRDRRDRCGDGRSVSHDPPGRALRRRRHTSCPSSTPISASPGASVPRSAGHFPIWPRRARGCVKPRPRKRLRWLRSIPWCSPRSRRPSRRSPCTVRRSTIDNRSARPRTRSTQPSDIAHDQFLAGSLSNLDLLTTEQSLVALDAAVASSDAALVQDQIAVFKALGGGWRGQSQGPP